MLLRLTGPKWATQFILQGAVTYLLNLYPLAFAIALYTTLTNKVLIENLASKLLYFAQDSNLYSFYD